MILYPRVKNAQKRKNLLSEITWVQVITHHF